MLAQIIVTPTPFALIIPSPFPSRNVFVFSHITGTMLLKAFRENIVQNQKNLTDVNERRTRKTFL